MFKDVFDLILLFITLGALEIALSGDNVLVISNGVSKLDGFQRRWFMLYGSFISIFLARTIIPWALMYAVLPQYGVFGVFSASMSKDPAVLEAVHEASRYIVVAGGSFLLGLFIFWFLEAEKEHQAFRWENNIVERYKILSSPVLWVLAMVYSVIIRIQHQDSFLSDCFLYGGFTFYSVWVLERKAEQREHMIALGKAGQNVGKWTPLIMLMLINVSFSVDSVVGVLAFSTNLLVIIPAGLLGGALVIYLTFRNMELIKKFRYAGQGGMYCVGFLAAIMLTEGLGVEVPEFLAPVVSMGIIGYFIWRSVRESKKTEPIAVVS